MKDLYDKIPTENPNNEQSMEQTGGTEETIISTKQHKSKAKEVFKETTIQNEVDVDVSMHEKKIDGDVNEEAAATEE